MYLGTISPIAFLGLDDFVPPQGTSTPKGPSFPPTPEAGAFFHRTSGMAFDLRRSEFVEAVRFATIALGFGMVGYIVFFH